MTNLKPFTGADDKRRQSGRQRGSKNISSLVREILESEVNDRLPINEDIKGLVTNNSNSSTSLAKAMCFAMIIKAINGNTQSANWVTDQYNKSPEPESFFSKTNFNFMVVPSRPREPEES